MNEFFLQSHKETLHDVDFFLDIIASDFMIFPLILVEASVKSGGLPQPLLKLRAALSIEGILEKRIHSFFSFV